MGMTPEQYWDVAYKTAKTAIKNEEKVIEDINKFFVYQEKDTKNKEEQLALEREETELCMKLYPKYGEEYIKDDLWKKHMQKKFKLMLKLNDERKESLRNFHSLKIKEAQTRASQAKDSITKSKQELKEAKIGKIEAKQNKLELVG